MRSKGVRGGTRDRGLGRVRELGTKAPPSWIRARDAILDTDDYTGRHLGYAKSPNPNSQSEGELSGKLSDKTTYDSASGKEGSSNYTQLLPYMPSNTFRMLICGPSGCGKTNTLMHMLYKLLFYDKIYLYAKNLEQPKYRELLEEFAPISDEVGYDVIEDSNDEIIPLEGLDDDNQKIVIFDDFVCEKNQKPLVDYFIGGRHKNCSVIYLSQSYYLTPKDIRLNCSHFCIFDSPSSNETARMCKEVNVPKGKFLKATAEPYSFAYIDKINKAMRKNFNENI